MTDIELQPSQTQTSEPLSLRVVANANHSKLARLVTLVSNMKKSPWLLSRCKESPSHIQALIDILRPEDRITVAVKLESPVSSSSTCCSPSSSSSWSRYLVVASTGDKHMVQESVLLGVDVVGEVVTLGLVLPICNDMDIQMDGDGGFNIVTATEKYSFRPVSVQAMWSALQSLVKAVCYARYHHQNREKSSHDWVSYYVSHLSSSHDCIYEWNRIMSGEFEIQGVDSTEDLKLKLTIKRKLRDIMTDEKDIDLETVTSKYLREKLEAMLNVSLVSFRRFVDEEMVIVMRQMDSPSQILDYLYLGSEWNASNLEELQQNKIGYILNVTREIDNFFPGMFKYCNVRVDDTEETHLLRHWNDTYNFIAQAKRNNSRILVHCKMGVSRSASTVIAYVMKECGKAFIDTYQYVKQKRNCVKPNPGFMQQLDTYEGILGASKHRHSKLFRSRSAENLDNKERDIEDDESFTAKRSKLEEKTQTEDEKPEVLSSSSDVDVCDSADTRSRPATFSIDSLDTLSPGSLPVITEHDTDGDQQGVNLPDLLEDEVLCEPGECGASLVPMTVFSDPDIPLSSMLRKLSFQTDTGEPEVDGRKHGRESQPAWKILRESELPVIPVRRRSSSWPARSKDGFPSPTKFDLILRPNAKKHRKLRGRRSNTIAVDD